MLCCLYELLHVIFELFGSQNGKVESFNDFGKMILELLGKSEPFKFLRDSKWPPIGIFGQNMGKIEKAINLEWIKILS